MIHRRTSIFGAIGAALLATTLTAQTTVNVVSNIDNTLYEDLAGATSNGAGTSVFCGLTGGASIRRALLRFDVAGSVPAGASIVAVSLSMNVGQSNDTVPMITDVHRVSRSWGEGTSVAVGGGGAGGTATTGDATWLHRFFNTTTWTTAGGDYVASRSATFPMPVIGPFTVPASPGLVADVQDWLNNPSTNFGWVLKAQDETIAVTARRINSREAASGRPTLAVTYLLPGQSASWGTGCPTSFGNFSFTFTGSMVGGQTAFLSHTNGPANSLAINIFALELNQPGIDLLPGCTVYLPASGAWITGFGFVIDGAGVGTLPWPLPTAYPGLYFMSQTVAIDPAAPLGFVLSNAGVGVIQ
ncbi:MAG: DNRLRE domain-containing protein [Planctomycetes bacterium]|nr:DNRLRE domain-containing protein [Planctomycetota bacterium]